MTTDTQTPAVAPEIAAAARSVAEAEAAFQVASATLRAAQDQVQNIHARLAAVQQRHASILTHRRAGEEHADDGAELALAMADAQNLADLEAEALAAVRVAQVPRDEVAGLVARAKVELARQVDQVDLRALVAHASEVEKCLTMTLMQIGTLTERMGVQTRVWTPSGQLEELLTRARLTGSFAGVRR